MKKLMMAAVFLASACSAQAAGSATASFDISFVVSAACTVQADSAAGPAATPSVACSQGTGYQLVRQPVEEAAGPGAAAAPSHTAIGAETWQIVF